MQGIDGDSRIAIVIKNILQMSSLAVGIRVTEHLPWLDVVKVVWKARGLCDGTLLRNSIIHVRLENAVCPPLRATVVFPIGKEGRPVNVERSRVQSLLGHRVLDLCWLVDNDDQNKHRRYEAVLRTNTNTVPRYLYGTNQYATQGIKYEIPALWLE
jgi:hypothetical protein